MTKTEKMACEICGYMAAEATLYKHMIKEHGFSLAKPTQEPAKTTPTEATNTYFQAATRPPTVPVDPLDQDFQDSIRSVRKNELEMLKLDQIRAMRRDTNTPAEHKQGGIMDRMLGTVVNPIVNKMLTTDNVQTQIAGIEARLDDLLANIPEEKREETGDIIGQLLAWGKQNPEQAIGLIKQFMPGIMGKA